MPDQKFHKRSPALSLKEIAALTGCEIAKGADASYKIEDVASLDTASSADISFLDNAKYKSDFEKTKAGACIVKPENAALAPKGVHLLLSGKPYRSYALVAQKLYPESWPKGSVAESAIVAKTTKLGKNVTVEHGAVIGENVVIGDDCWIGANATISHAIIGSHVRIYPGVRIGQDGFGFVPDPKGHIKVPQLGRVIIEDGVEIGANSTIDRGSGPDTVIGQGTWLDNLVHIAHNVKIGKGCLIAGQVGIAGSTVVGDFVAMGGQVGISGHLKIGSGAKLAAKSGVTKDVPAGAEYMGYPAMPMRQYLRGVAYLNHLINNKKSS